MLCVLTLSCNLLLFSSFDRCSFGCPFLPHRLRQLLLLSIVLCFLRSDYFLYTQQESIYYALFNEVTEAKSLLEQVALVCQGRSMYRQCLDSISAYVQDDLKMIHLDPAVLLSARPVDDPLESIMYMTSVGIPSSVYETVKSLRQARAARLGALQRKLPPMHSKSFR